MQKLDNLLETLRIISLTFETPFARRTLRSFGSCDGQTIFAILAMEPILTIPTRETILSIGTSSTWYSIESRFPGHSIPAIQAGSSGGSGISLGSSRSGGTQVTHTIDTGGTW